MCNEAGYCSAFNMDFSETVAYNNPLFPAYVRYGILSNYPDYSAISHWHEDLEFIYVKKGKMTYNVNGELVELPENTGIMVNSRQLHFGFSEEHHECEFLCILLSPELLRGNRWFYQTCIEYITHDSRYPYLFLKGEEWQGQILGKLDALYRIYAEKEIGAVCCFRTLEFFCFIMEKVYENLPVKPSFPVRENAELNALRDMMTYIEEHFTQPVSLADIALAGACCKSRCSALFRKYLLDTPVTYMTKLRLKKSLDSLLHSDACITEIAYENGFCSGSYYCETFRKYYGMPPLQYRKMQIKRNERGRTNAAPAEAVTGTNDLS